MSPKISTHFISKQIKNVKNMSVFVWTLHIKWLQIYSVPYGQTCFRLGGLPLKMLQICVKTGWSCPRLYLVIRCPRAHVPLDRRHVTPDAILWTLCAICKTTR